MKLVSFTGGGGLPTVIEMAAEVVDAESSSVAIAVREWTPWGALCQRNENGGIVSVPSEPPFAKNSTEVTEPSESLAFADTVTSAGVVKVEPSAGAEIETDGGVLPPG